MIVFQAVASLRSGRLEPFGWDISSETSALLPADRGNAGPQGFLLNPCHLVDVHGFELVAYRALS